MTPIAGNVYASKTQTEYSIKWSLRNYRVHEAYYGRGVISPEFQVANYCRTFMKFQHVEQYAVVDLNVPEVLDVAGLVFKIYIIDESEGKMTICGNEPIRHVPCQAAERHPSTDERNCFIRHPVISRNDILGKKGCLNRDTLTLLCQISIVERMRPEKYGCTRHSSCDESAFIDETLLSSPSSSINARDSCTESRNDRDSPYTCAHVATNTFDEFYDAPSFSDVSISVENRIFHAHKIILAAYSPVFRAMFTNLMCEARENLVKITDSDANSFEAFMRALYTGTIDKLEKHAADILILADKYQVDGLKNISEEYIVNNLKPVDAIRYLILAHSYNSPNLKRRALSLATSCGKQITVYPDFHKLCSYPDLLAEIMQNML